ncbi:hypothetical protein ACTXT7_012563 [Hymenolepis weldensis]
MVEDRLFLELPEIKGDDITSISLATYTPGQGMTAPTTTRPTLLLAFHPLQPAQSQELQPHLQ